jgi:hypothetical protein
MYTHWQAAWRSAGALGVVLLAFMGFALYFVAQASSGIPVLAVPMALLAAGVLTAILAVSFRLGLGLSGIRVVGLSVVVATPAIYFLVLLVLRALPIETHEVALNMPSPPQTSRHAILMLNMVPASVIAIALLVLPIAVAFVVARLAKGRASDA